MEEARGKAYYITVAVEKDPVVHYLTGQVAEDVCIKLCRQYQINPVARHLFALRNKSSRNSGGCWYQDGYKFDGREKSKLEFRIRYKPSSLRRLRSIDAKGAYNYYFQQARADVLESKVPDIVYDKHKRELIGLGVCDMYRFMLENRVTQEAVESNYKLYIPKECIKRHSFFIKKPIHNALSRIRSGCHNPDFVREQYLHQFESMAPNYLSQDFKAIMEADTTILRVSLRVNAVEIKYCAAAAADENNGSSSWKSLCAIQDLCFVSANTSVSENTVEVSRKNGIPTYFRFSSYSLLMSFVSALNGYYRLSVKWTFNLSGDAITPSLDRLYKLKCHGPVGGEFSYAKLEEKRSNRPGTFILRESETEYDSFYLDACGKDSKPRTWKITRLGEQDFALSDCMQRYKSIAHIVAAHQQQQQQQQQQESAAALYLKECLPPSEYDKSPLLLCAPEGFGSDAAADEEIIARVLEGRPCCVSPHELQVYKAQPLSAAGAAAASSRRPAAITALYKAMWRVSKGKRLETAVKLLLSSEMREPSSAVATKDFLKLAQQWGQLRSSAIVRLYGVTLAPSVGMLLELVKLGPLDLYLREIAAPQTIKTVDLVEAAACLATAVWHLEEHGVVHGRIRCRKLLVQSHTGNAFIVKLADPGLFSYKPTDVHWLPPECYVNPDLARRNTQADVWAVATTLWEIFSRGKSLCFTQQQQQQCDPDFMKKWYASGNRLSIPPGCPPEVYRLMQDCWAEIGTRKNPQAVMRDINQIKYQVFNSRRRIHDYAVAQPVRMRRTAAAAAAAGQQTADGASSDCDGDATSQYTASEHDSSATASDCESRASSLFTDRTSLPWEDSLLLEDIGGGGGSPVSEWIGVPPSSSPPPPPFFNSSSTNLLFNSPHLDAASDQQDDDDVLSTWLGGWWAAKTAHGCCPDTDPNGGATADSLLGQMQSIFELNTDCNVILQGRIGQGFYGEVYLGTLEREKDNEQHQQQVAVKKLKMRAIEAEVRDFEREIDIMKTLQHPNVVGILGVISEPEVCLVMEFVKHGSLQSYLAIHRESLTVSRLLSFALDIATGMDYLGSKSIVHRDLAARNILVADDNRVKISDFGLAQVTNKNQNDYYILQTNRNLPIKWYAPESLRDGKFSPRSDVWSFGVTMFEMFSFGEDPKLPEFAGLRQQQQQQDNNTDSSLQQLSEEEGTAELLKALESGARLPCPPFCPQEVYVKIMHPCWHIHSQQRPDFAKLCRVIRDLKTATT